MNNRSESRNALVAVGDRAELIVMVLGAPDGGIRRRP
jgi:hypothetical protein